MGSSSGITSTPTRISRERGQVSVSERPGRSRIHASCERLAHGLLDRDDPRVDRDPLDQQPRLAGGPGRVAVEQAKEAEDWQKEKHALPDEIVQRLLEEVDLQGVRAASSSATRRMRATTEG
jgi:hypothetical protein